MLTQLSNSSLLKTHSYIDGQWQSSESRFQVINPATEQPLCDVSEVSKEQVQQAIAAAEKAQKAWAEQTAEQRTKLLKQWHRLILEHKDDLAMMMTLEQGKPLAEAKGEMLYGAAFVDWYAEEAKRVYGEILPTNKKNQRIHVIKQPIGIVAAITPWNFPSSMITRKVAPALAAGCSVVIKPSELTPLSALALAELADQAGIPAGVFNVVVGTDAHMIGMQLTKDSRVRKFSFTGSTAVGKQLLEQCASTVKKVSLELGGNAPFIVFDSADIDHAVSGVMASKYRNAGQTCVCTNRVLVDTKIVDEFTEKLTEKICGLRLGDGLDKKTNIGPLITSKAVCRINNLIEQSVEQGATIIGHSTSESLGSHFMSPKLLTNVNPSMPIAQQEIFGPVVSIIPFDNEQQAIDIANDTHYGLAAYFYSNDLAQITRVSEQLEYGMVGVNEALISNPTVPFGGVKESGLGREGSKHGIDEFLELKYICLGGL
ncbi:MAG: NAD-dependent succinate-semialdehyde dehydrogenase [Kangiellaceae bacterium]|jgi:succinate-semialdehyde dehydrogenase/glutarate-semialdehyde dehydrogenase|nr:NAD-dependent succinate-semialdehyde dehydrogenase [Kangiellaceae bacterium]